MPAAKKHISGPGNGNGNDAFVPDSLKLTRLISKHAVLLSFRFTMLPDKNLGLLSYCTSKAVVFWDRGGKIFSSPSLHMVAWAIRIRLMGMPTIRFIGRDNLPFARLI